MGYNLFKRNETNKIAGTDPWDLEDQEALELAEEVD